MSESLSRRNLLKSIALAAGTAAAAQTLVPTANAQAAKPAAAPAAAAAKPKLDPKSPAAVALGYFEDATKVDAKKFPMHKPNQFCSNCLQVQGKDGEAWRGCNLFPKNLVANKGWCKVWVKKPGTA
jgi:hypothetical protein